MSETKSGFWDIGYSDLNVSCMGGPSIEIYEIAPFIRKGAKVVELGAGEGRNSLYLALLGHEVIATDISQQAINKLNFLAKELNVNIKSFVQDVTEYEQTEEFDVLIAQTVFHFTTKELWTDKLKVAKEKTRPGGIHCFTNFLDSDEFPIPNEILEYGHKKSFTRGDLEEFYSDWEIIRSDLYVKWDSHPGIPMHSHLCEKIVVRKPFDRSKDYNDFTKREIVSEVKLDEEIFQSLTLGESYDLVVKDLPASDQQKIIKIKQRSVAGNNQSAIADHYELLDVFYDDRALQFTNGKLSGKYLYFTTPVEIKSQHD